MAAIFIICAAVGGTILACQLLMTVLGFAGDVVDVDVPDDIDGGGDLDFGDDVDAGGVAHHDTSWIAGVISFRTLVAAMTFFGLAGWAARGADFSVSMQVVIALAAGVASMYGVYYLMRLVYSLKAEGTVRVGSTVGRHGTVYLTIPGHQSGAGKVQLSVQKRTMEYLAMTSGDELPTGTKVKIVDVITSNTVEVEPILEPERTENV